MALTALSGIALNYFVPAAIERTFVHQVIRRAEQATMFVAGLCIVAMMIVVSADALCRYAFNAPLRWVFDLVSNYLLIFAVYFALSPTYSHGDHIGIDLIKERLPPAAAAGMEVVSSLLAVVVFMVIAYGSFRSGHDAYLRGDAVPGVISWPSWLSYAPIPLGAGLMSLRLLHHCAMLVRFGSDPFVQAEGEPQE